MAQWHFPEAFLWGTATASYQVEGAAGAGGRRVAKDSFHYYREVIAGKEGLFDGSDRSDATNRENEQ